MRLLFCLSLIFLFTACQNDSESHLFSLVPSEDTGIDFNNVIEQNGDFNIMKNEYMYNGGGVGVADFNNDGLQDIYFCGNKVSSKLYLNQGEFKFKDATSSFASMDTSIWVSGVAVVDINNDGWQDLYLSCTQGESPEQRKNQLWINNGVRNGDLTFNEMAESYGIAHDGYSTQSAFIDYDMDGDLDLYVMNNIIDTSVPTNYRTKITDGTAKNNDAFFRNNGDGTFTDVTIEANITMEGFGLGINVHDFNGDGYPDIYISNDYVSNDLLYINQKDGTFKNEINDYLSYQSRFSMGNDAADLNGDGIADIITLDMLPEDYQRVKNTVSATNYIMYLNDEKYGYEHQFSRNLLHMSQGKMGQDSDDMIPYAEIGQLAGIHGTEWSWSPLFADYNNDGKLDITITNGFPKDLTDKDFANFKAHMYGYLMNDKEIIKKIPVVDVPNYIYEQTDDYVFADRTADWGMDIPSFSNGASFVDLDNDGDLDFVVNNINQQAFIYENNLNSLLPASNYIRIKLIGDGQNKNAVGTKVTAHAGSKKWSHEHHLSRGYLSSVEPVIHIGLDSNVSQIDSLIVIWDNNSKSKFENVAINTVHEIQQNEQNIEPHSVQNVVANAIFRPSDIKVDYRHNQEDFIDFFQTQRTILKKQSQFGPVIEVADLDSDGMEDIVVGGAAGDGLIVYKQSKVGSFQPYVIDSYNVDISDLEVTDINNDGKLDIAVVTATTDITKRDLLNHHVYIQKSSGFDKQIIGTAGVSYSKILVYDLDSDGQKDIFLGSKGIEGSYPNATPSSILLQKNGQYEAEESRNYGLGMVEDAKIADLNGDGQKDIVVLTQGKPIMGLVADKHGAWNPIPNVLNSNASGFWNHISVVDMDGDGDDDFVLGNLGLNTRYQLSEELPMNLYAPDVDENGTADPVFTRFWTTEDGVEEYPVHFLEDYAVQSPLFRKRFPDFHSFARANIDSMLTQEQQNRLLQYNDTKSYIIMNNGTSFDWKPLPIEAQWSPIQSAISDDFTGDGLLDLLVVGNDRSFDIFSGIFDANRGLLLEGDGKGNFKTVTQAECGLNLKGQNESVHKITIGGQEHILVGTNRDSLLLFNWRTSH